ncbi:restriction endonuclease [Inquilinus sp. KBS0705]|nr:restriction endonuclease [Inquilinus sp. KBS0705]
MEPEDFSSAHKTIKFIDAIVNSNSYQNVINSPLKLTLDLIAKSSTYQNAVNPPALRFINKAMTNHQPIWTADFVRQMTSFQKTSSVINIRQGAYESSLAALGYGTGRSSAMFLRNALAASLDGLLAHRYDLIAEPVLEVAESKIILFDEVSRIKAAISEIYRDNEAIYRLEARDFEQMVAELMREKNFDVELTKQTRDGGYDLIALQDTGGFPYRFLIECKRFARHRRVDVNIVRSFCQVLSEEKSNGIIVTSAYFSADAKRYQKKFAPYHLNFRDRDDILEWVNQYVMVKP